MGVLGNERDYVWGFLGAEGTVLGVFWELRGITLGVFWELKETGVVEVLWSRRIEGGVVGDEAGSVGDTGVLWTKEGADLEDQ